MPETTSLVDAHDRAVLAHLNYEDRSSWPENVKAYVAAAAVKVADDLPGRKAYLKGLAKVGSEWSWENRRRFYLHLPDRSTPQRQVVVPVEPKSTLREILLGRVVREFPTVFVELPGVDDLDLEKFTVLAPTPAQIVSVDATATATAAAPELEVETAESHELQCFEHGNLPVKGVSQSIGTEQLLAVLSPENTEAAPVAQEAHA